MVRKMELCGLNQGIFQFVPLILEVLWCLVGIIYALVDQLAHLLMVFCVNKMYHVGWDMLVLQIFLDIFW